MSLFLGQDYDMDVLIHSAEASRSTNNELSWHRRLLHYPNGVHWHPFLQFSEYTGHGALTTYESSLVGSSMHRNLYSEEINNFIQVPRVSQSDMESVSRSRFTYPFSQQLSHPEMNAIRGLSSWQHPWNVSMFAPPFQSIPWKYTASEPGPFAATEPCHQPPMQGNTFLASDNSLSFDDRHRSVMPRPSSSAEIQNYVRAGMINFSSPFDPPKPSAPHSVRLSNVPLAWRSHRFTRPPVSWVPDCPVSVQESFKPAGILWALRYQCKWIGCAQTIDRGAFSTCEAYLNAVYTHFTQHANTINANAMNNGCGWEGCSLKTRSGLGLKHTRDKMRHIVTHLPWYTLCTRCTRLSARRDVRGGKSLCMVGECWPSANLAVRVRMANEEAQRAGLNITVSRFREIVFIEAS